MSRARARPLWLFSGKGGVGKTTLASAAALLAARRGERTLLVSTDPAHSVADALATPLGDTPRAVAEGLDAVEIDPEAAAAAHVHRIKETIAGSVDSELLPAVHRHLDLSLHSPGTIESALFDRMVSYMDVAGGQYERVVFDTAPTGHTLRLLTLPALLTAWVSGLVRQRERVAGMDRMLHNMAGAEGDPEADPVLARLHERRAAFLRARERLEHDADVWLVLTPERLAIEETSRAAASLNDAGLPVAGLVLNRVLPEDDDSAYLRVRREQEATYLDEIAARFDSLRRLRVTLQPRDVVGLTELEAVTAELAAGGW